MYTKTLLWLGFAIGANAFIYNLAATIPWPETAPSSVDQSTIYNGNYFLADRTNKGVHVINLSSNTEKALISGGFILSTSNGSTVPAKSGPDGLVVLSDRNEMYVGDANGTIRVVDLTSNAIVASISTGSATRADEFAYNPSTHLVVATNPNEDPPYVSIVNATSRTVLGNIVFNNASGLEQPAYNPADGSFWISVPSTDANPGGEVVQIDPVKLTIIKTYLVPSCVNAGIIFGPTNTLFISCSADQQKSFNLTRSYIMDITSGKITHNVSNVNGADQVAYSNKTGFFYAASYQQMNGSTPSPNVAVIASNGTVLQQITTDNVTAHAVAVDDTNGNVIVPVKSKGILVFSLSSSSTSPGGIPSSSPTIAPYKNAATEAVSAFGWVFTCCVSVWMLKIACV